MNFQPKLSLLAQFDDISRLTEQLGIGVENEFMTFVKGQSSLRRDLENAFKIIEKKDKELLETKKAKDALEIKLQHARNLVETEMRKREEVEREKNCLQRQIAIIREVLLTDQSNLNDQAKEKLAFLSSQSYRSTTNLSPRRLTTIEESMGFSLSDVSFDKTEDDLDTEENVTPEKNKRGSVKSRKTHKKAKYDNNFLDDVESSDIDKISTNELKFEFVNTRGKRYQSEPISSSRDSSPHIITESDNDPVPFTEELANKVHGTKLTENTPTNFRNSSSKIYRKHTFCTKTVIRPETCLPCNTRIGFYKQALKCQDCRVTCHPDCKDDVPLPCYPISHTPTNKKLGTIVDFVPNNPPLIPAILVHCINEIETRGLEETGLYRVSGSEKEVRELKDKFLKGKFVPCLSKIDIHAICGTIKEFLRSLNEPLISRNLWRSFVNAAKIAAEDDDGSLYDTINKLPLANRDTLAYLILHLQRIAQSPKCRMPIENLAKIFSPTIVGYSSSEPTNMLSETDSITLVMYSLLKLPSSFWVKFVCIGNTLQKERPEEPINSNRLGPITGGTPSYKSRGVHVGKTPLTPRHEFGVRTRPKKPFFASPLLK